MTNKPLMKAEDVLEFCQNLEALGINIWIDGGWAVDAVLGGQTRDHDDLDIVIRQKDVPALRKFLTGRGYENVPRDDTSPWNFVLGDSEGKQIDIHAVVFDDEGNGLYGPPEKGVMYPAASLTGEGTISGRPVKTVAPEYLVKFRTGYKLREKDFKDVAALCEKFGIEAPEEYRSLKDRPPGPDR